MPYAWQYSAPALTGQKWRLFAYSNFHSHVGHMQLASDCLPREIEVHPVHLIEIALDSHQWQTSQGVQEKQQ
jgi:hypothetical protein